VSIALDLLADCFPEQMKTLTWQGRLKALFPSWGRKLADDVGLAAKVRDRSATLLQLDPMDVM
jgi:malate dehydrogenase (quinone)